MYWVAVVTAGVTAFYVSRSMFLTFFGEFRGAAALAAGHHGHDDHDQHHDGHDAHAHGHDNGHADHSHDHAHDTVPREAPAVMWLPLAVLAILSLVGGFFDLPHFLEPALPHAEHIEHEVATLAQLDDAKLAEVFGIEMADTSAPAARGKRSAVSKKASVPRKTPMPKNATAQKNVSAAKKASAAKKTPIVRKTAGKRKATTVLARSASASKHKRDAGKKETG